MRCQNKFSELLESTRQKHGLSQRRLALRAGTSQDAISRIERGVEAPTLERFVQLMLAMGERVTVAVEPLESRVTHAELVAAAEMTAAERFREAASWNLLAARLGVAGERARRAEDPAAGIESR